MGDQFEKFILENKAAFNDESPSEELWSEIDKRLERKRSGFQIVWKVAAVLFLLSTIYLLVDKRQIVEAPQLSQEFIQAEDYYTTLIIERKQLIQQKLTKEEETQFLQDIDHLDSMYEELKKTYQSNASNDRVVDAMINNLQLRLDILNRQLEILEKIKGQKNEKDIINI